MSNFIWWLIYAASAVLLFAVGFGRAPAPLIPLATAVAYTLTLLMLLSGMLALIGSLFASYVIESATKDSRERYADPKRVEQHRKVLEGAIKRTGLFDIQVWGRTVSCLLAAAAGAGIACSGRPVLATLFAALLFADHVSVSALVDIAKRAPAASVRLEKLLTEDLPAPTSLVAAPSPRRAVDLDSLQRRAESIAAEARRRR